MDPLLTAFAKAVERMPVLEQFLLETELGYDKGYWDISYHAPGIKADGDANKDDAKVREYGDQTTSLQKLFDVLGGIVMGRS